jgi:hypothetical protein
MIIYKMAWSELTSKISAQELDEFYLFVTEKLVEESILAPTAAAIATGNEATACTASIRSASKHERPRRRWGCCRSSKHTISFTRIGLEANGRKQHGRRRGWQRRWSVQMKVGASVSMLPHLVLTLFVSCSNAGDASCRRLRCCGDHHLLHRHSRAVD